jgi:putative inorganic carbon (HCO3(-)) transporter
VMGSFVTSEGPTKILRSGDVRQGSQAYRSIESATRRLDSIICAFFSWFDCVFHHSLIGEGVLYLGQKGATWVSSSFFAKWSGWFLRLLFTPCNQPVTEGTFFGIILALGAFVSTDMQILSFAVFLFILLWRRVTLEQCGSPLAHLPFQLVLPFMFLFLFIAGATVSSVAPGQSLMNFVLWCFNGLVFLVAFDTASRGREDSVIWPFLTGVTLSSMVGIYQHLSGWQPPRSWLDAKFEDEIVRVVGTFRNPTFFAEMIGLALPLSLALLIKNKSLRDKVVLLVYVLIQGTALVLTWSRGAWLGFIASLAIMAVLFDKRLLIVGLGLAIAGVIVAPPVLVERLLSSFTLDDSSNSYRLFIWRGSIALLRDNLFRGVGLGAESFVQIYPEYMIIQTPAPHAHSTYLQMLIELGLCGFLVLMWLLLACPWYAMAALFAEKGRGFERWAYTGVLSGVVGAAAGHMLQGVVEHTWYNPQITAIFWAWLGVAVGVSCALRSRGPGEAPRKEAPCN